MQPHRRPWWRWLYDAWTGPFTAPVPAQVREPLLRYQFERFAANLPRLHAMMALNALAMAVAVYGDLPLWQQITPPAIIIVTCLLSLAFGPRRADRQSPEALLRLAAIMATFMAVVSGIWAVNAFIETERYYCMVAPVFIGLGALISASSMLAAPRAAIVGMVVTVAPIIVKLVSYPNTGVRAMAVVLILVTATQCRIVLEKFRETVAMLTYQLELDRLAWTDGLTGLDNRRAFTNQLSAALDQGAPVLVAIADLDGMKAANDFHGHLAGDEVLVEVSRRMRQVAVTAASVARLGGDEFAVLYVGTGQAAREQAEAELAAIRRAVPMPVVWGDKLLTIATSMGVASSPEDGSDMSLLLACADERLYADKATNRAARAAASAPRLHAALSGGSSRVTHSG